MRKVILLTVATLIGLQVYSQNEMDAERIISGGLSGTARVQAMGGAFSAAGGDFTSASLNPAGLALYKRSDFMITTGLRFVRNQAAYLGQQETEYRNRLGLTNLGLVLYGGYRPYSDYGRAQEKGPKLRSYAFSVGFNQLENFYRQTRGMGFNENNSFSSYLASRAQGTRPEQLPFGSLAEMGYYVWLIDPMQGDSTMYNAAAPNNVLQSVNRTEKGRLNEWNFGLSGNFEDFLYMGLSVGIRSLDYGSTYTFQEEDSKNIHGGWGAYNANTQDSVGFNSLQYSERFTTNGSGVNVGFGVIVRPSDFARLGLSVQSPTWYSLNDQYTNSMSNTSDLNQNYSVSSREGYFEYNFTSPYKVTGGVSFVIAQSLLLNADVDVLDYRTARFNSNTYAFRTENQNIQNMFDRAYNYRMGAEYKYGPLYFRGGFAWFDPVMNDLGNTYTDMVSNGTMRVNAGRRNITGGFGYREESFYIDLGLVNQRFQDKYSVYSGGGLNGLAPVLVNTVSRNTYLMTFGLRF